MMFKLILVAVITLLFAKVCQSIYKLWNTRKKLIAIPGPNTQLLNGNLYLFWQQKSVLSSEKFFNILRALAQLYQQEGMFKLRFGSKFIVCLFHSRHLKELIASSVNINKSTEYNFLQDWIGNGLLLAPHKHWFVKRSLLAKVFHKDAFPRFVTLLSHKADSFVETLSMTCNENGGQGQYYCNESTFHFTMESISECLLDYQLKPNETDSYLDCIHKITSSFTKRALNPFLWFGPVFRLTTIGRTYWHYLQLLKQLTNKIVKQKLVDSGEIMSKLVDKSNLIWYLWNKSSESTVDTIGDEVDTFLFAGHDTTALSINWVLYFIGLYPEEQFKLREEIQLEMDNNNSKEIQLKHLDRLVYLECFIKECLRLYPPVPLIGREVSEELTVGKHTIPRGTMMYVLIDQLNLESANYPSANQFQPNRFLEKHSAISYMPFSAGPRNCIGKKLALLMIKMVIVKILSRFRIESEDKRDQLELSYNIVLKPKHALKLRLIALDG